MPNKVLRCGLRAVTDRAPLSIATINAAIQEISTSEEKYLLTDQVIRGTPFKVFKNGPKNLRDVLDLCIAYGDADFLVYEEERYTFADVYRRTHRLAHVLVEVYGVKPGDRVALLMRNLPEYPMLFMALASVGAVTVFLNSWWTSRELEHAFGDCDAKLAFVDAARAELLKPFAGKLGVEFATVRGPRTEKIPAFWGHMDAGPESLSPSVDIEPDDDFAVMYTSGSSGHPKGVVLTHRGITCALQSWFFMARVYEVTGDEVPGANIDSDGNAYQGCKIVTTPFFHISGSVAGFLMCLWAGLKLVIMHKWDAHRAAELVDKEKVSHFSGVPTMTAELIEAAADMGSSLQYLRRVDSGGSKRPPAQVDLLAKSIPHALPGNGWGMTETGGLGISARGPEYIKYPDSSGRLQPPLQEMRVVDEQGRDVPRGEVGELVIKSVTNMRCYLNQMEETAKVLRDGWLHTGDLVRVNDEEIIFMVDRKKDMVIRGGENISCSEVHAALHVHPDIAEAAVFSIPDSRLGETVGACVYLRKGAKLSGEGVKEFLSSHLAAFKIPDRVWFSDKSLPRGGSEKIDRRALRSSCLEGEVASEPGN